MGGSSMNIKCPHGKIVKQTIKFGLTLYEHEDGKFCDMMSNFGVTVKDIDRVTAKYNKLDIDDVKNVAMCDSPHVYPKLVKMLSSLNAVELTKCLDTMVKKRYFDYIGRELFIEFGFAIVGNLQFIGHNKVADKIREGKFVKNFKESKMTNIRRESVRQSESQLNDIIANRGRSLREAILNVK
jgi:hypothetical protein